MIGKPSYGLDLATVARSAAIAEERQAYRLRIRREMEHAIERLGYGPGRPVRALRRPQPGQ